MRQKETHAFDQFVKDTRNGNATKSNKWGGSNITIPEETPPPEAKECELPKALPDPNAAIIPLSPLPKPKKVS